MFRFCALLIASIFLFNTPALHAQETDYMKHGKIFCLCSFKKTCSECYECDKNRYQVKIENHVNKQIKKVHYQYYSDVFNRIMEKEAKIEGKIIDPRITGLMHICVPHGQHWIISRITYEDGSENKFILRERFETFKQEPDECDCND